MNGGYIIMPERLSNELMRKVFYETDSANGEFSGLTEVCEFLHNAVKIGKPIVMSGYVRDQQEPNSYTDYPYCSYIINGTKDTFMLLHQSEAFVIHIRDLSKGTISYFAIDRA